MPHCRLRIYSKISECLYPRFGGGIDILFAMLLPMPLNFVYEHDDSDAILDLLIALD